MTILNDSAIAAPNCAATAPELRLSCHESPSCLAAVMAQVAPLTRGRPEPLLYMTPAYLASYVQTFTDRSYLVIHAHRGEALVGAAFFCRGVEGSLQVLRFIGEGLWGYAGLLTQDTGEAGAEVAAELLRAALAHCRPQRLDIGPLHASALSLHVAAVNRLRVPAALVKYVGGAPWIDPLQDRSVWIKQRKKGAYSDALRCEKRLAELGQVRVFKLDNAVLTDAAVASAMSAFMAMYWRQWPDNRMRREPRWIDFYRNFALAAAREGTLEFAFLTLDGKPLAAHYGFVHEGRRYYFTPTYDVDYAKYSPGKVLMRHLIDSSFAERVVFDFQNDLEPYKLDWTSVVADRFLIRLQPT